MDEEYTCDACGGTFVNHRPKAEVEAEFEDMKKNAIGATPEELAEPPAVVCDDCFNEIMEWARQTGRYPPGGVMQ